MGASRPLPTFFCAAYAVSCSFVGYVCAHCVVHPLTSIQACELIPRKFPGELPRGELPCATLPAVLCCAFHTCMFSCSSPSRRCWCSCLSAVPATRVPRWPQAFQITRIVRATLVLFFAASAPFAPTRRWCLLPATAIRRWWSSSCLPMPAQWESGSLSKATMARLGPQMRCGHPMLCQCED